MSGKKVKLEIVALSYSQTQNGAYALVLGEANGKRRLPIIIGGYEAQAIAIELEKMTPSRPLTHDLMKTFAESFNITISEVVIYKIMEGVFYARMNASNGSQHTEIDARTSDAIALALRFDCPIYTYDSILSTYGIMLDDDTAQLESAEDEEKTVHSGQKGEFGTLNSEELQKLLQSALDNEDYEKASRIRDEIEQRKNN